jgi:hypothetical protein
MSVRRYADEAPWLRSGPLTALSRRKTDVETIIGFVRSGCALHDVYGF